ncbi:small multi-drug export protein [Paenibacillus apiarius]|uniref:small multi-drug export protein n=1 Tax=Paenibacillus apiarius TaxID=46240 RepID=UPI003B3A2388
MDLDFLYSVPDEWKYGVLFLFAALPWLEVFVVIPLGILMGLSPIPVALAGFLGNLIPILLIGLLFKKWQEWRQKRGKSIEPSPKWARAQKIWDRYGVPGLSLLAPIIIGTDIATILALSFGSPRKWVVAWMTVSLAVWSIVLTVGTVYGFDFITYLTA